MSSVFSSTANDSRMEKFASHSTKVYLCYSHHHRQSYKYFQRPLSSLRGGYQEQQSLHRSPECVAFPGFTRLLTALCRYFLQSCAHFTRTIRRIRYIYLQASPILLWWRSQELLCSLQTVVCTGHHCLKSSWQQVCVPVRKPKWTRGTIQWQRQLSLF